MLIVSLFPASLLIFGFIFLISNIYIFLYFQKHVVKPLEYLSLAITTFQEDYQSIEKQINFPIATNSKYIKNLAKNEANAKYIKPAKQGTFDAIQFKINY